MSNMHVTYNSGYIPYHNTIKRKLHVGFFTKCALCNERLYHKNKSQIIFSRIIHMECMYKNIRRKNNRS